MGRTRVLRNLHIHCQASCHMLKPSTTFFRHEPRRSQLLNELWTAQKRDGYITEQTMESLASSMDISLIEVRGIVSFYHFFHTQPTARHVIYLNNSLISKTKGYERIREALEATGIPELAHRNPSRLSSGQLARAAIARATS